jgi:hypothetical protein
MIQKRKAPENMITGKRRIIIFSISNALIGSGDSKKLIALLTIFDKAFKGNEIVNTPTD